MTAHQLHALAGYPALRASLRYKLDCRQFRNNRQSYYRYLADLLEGLRGSRSLRDIFLTDSLRYGTHSWRGRIYARWAALYEASGGDLHAIWSGAIPDAELGILRSAQSRGNDVFNRCLSELAQTLARAGRMKAMIAATLSAAGVALLLVSAVVLAIPFYTVPELLGAFNMVQPANYGPRTQALLGFSQAVRLWAPLAVPLLVVVACAVSWSLQGLTGRVRSSLDRVSVWWIYRQVQAQRVLAMLVIVLGRDDYGPVQLRTAVQLLREGASAWVGWRLDQLLERLDQGLPPDRVFQAGLLDKEQAWYLADMMGARGLCAGMALTADRLHETLHNDVAMKAQRLRWSLLLMAVATMLFLTLWHYAVIDELRRSLVNFYAGH